MIDSEQAHVVQIGDFFHHLSEAEAQPSVLRLNKAPVHFQVLRRVRHITLGIGVNVNQSAGDFPADLRRIASSLRVETGRTVPRAELAAAILRELDHDYARVVGGFFPDVADEWEEHCSTLGQPVTIRMGDRTVRGQAESLDDDGALLLRTEHGRIERVIGGDVTLEK